MQSPIPFYTARLALVSPIRNMSRRICSKQSSTHSLHQSHQTHLLEILILPVWEDTPLNSAAIRGHHNMSTLILIPAGHMRFVPAHKQSDEDIPVLFPAKWPVELVFIANAKGQETISTTTGSIRSRSRQTRLLASSRMRKHYSSRPHPPLGAGSGVV